jgi:hypothetical protein
MAFPLKKGAKGPEVKVVQAFLNLSAELFGFSGRVPEDGDFTQKTEELLGKVFRRSEVSNEEYQLGLKTLPDLRRKVADKRAGAPSIDTKLRNIMVTDEKLAYELVTIYEIVKALQKKGIDLTPYGQQLARAMKAAKKLNERQRTIREQKEIPIVLKDSYSKQFGPLLAKYQGSKVSGAMVVVGLLFPPAIPFMVGYVAATKVKALYEYFTGADVESKADFVETKQVRAVLEKLSPVDQQVILDAANSQIDDAYKEGAGRGRAQGWWKGFSTLGKPMLYVVGGAGLYFGGKLLVKRYLPSRG